MPGAILGSEDAKTKKTSNPPKICPSLHSNVESDIKQDKNKCIVF